MSDGWGDGCGSRGPGGRCIRHAAEAAPGAVGPLVVPMIEPAFQTLLVSPVGVPPVLPLRGLAAAVSAVGLPPVAGPADVEHRAASRAAAHQPSPRHGAGHRARTRAA